MRRRVIKLAEKTLVMSLPARWTRRWGIAKGHELEVEELGHRLVLSQVQDTTQPLNTELNLEGTDSSLFRISISAAYRAGYDEIVVRHRPRVFDVRTQKTIPTARVLAEIATQRIGLELVEQSSHATTLRALGEVKRDELEPTKRRIFHAIASLGKDGLEAVMNRDKELLMSLATSEDARVNRLVDFCLRVIAKHPEIPAHQQQVLLSLEELGDSYVRLFKLAAHEKNPVPLARALKALNELFASLHAACYTPLPSKLQAFSRAKNAAWRYIKSAPKNALWPEAARRTIELCNEALTCGLVTHTPIPANGKSAKEF